MPRLLLKTGTLLLRSMKTTDPRWLRRDRKATKLLFGVWFLISAELQMFWLSTTKRIIVIVRQSMRKKRNKKKRPSGSAVLTVCTGPGDCFAHMISPLLHLSRLVVIIRVSSYL